MEKVSCLLSLEFLYSSSVTIDRYITSDYQIQIFLYTGKMESLAQSTSIFINVSLWQKEILSMHVAGLGNRKTAIRRIGFLGYLRNRVFLPFKSNFLLDRLKSDFYQDDIFFGSFSCN